MCSPCLVTGIGFDSKPKGIATQDAVRRLNLLSPPKQQHRWGMREPPPQAKKVVVYHPLKKNPHFCLWGICVFDVLFVSYISLFVEKQKTWHLWNLSRSNPWKKRRLTTPPPPIDRKNKAPETWLSGSRSVHPRRRLPSAQSSPNRGFF